MNAALDQTSWSTLEKPLQSKRTAGFSPVDLTTSFIPRKRGPTCQRPALHRCRVGNDVAAKLLTTVYRLFVSLPFSLNSSPLIVPFCSAGSSTLRLLDMAYSRLRVEDSVMQLLSLPIRCPSFPGLPELTLPFHSPHFRAFSRG